MLAGVCVTGVCVYAEQKHVIELAYKEGTGVTPTL